MQQRIKQFFLNTAVLLCTIFFLIFGAETIMRAISKEPGEAEWVGAEKKYYEYDPLYGWKKIPNLNTVRITAGKLHIRYEINSKSIRGPEYSYEKAGNEYRILILGDSFTEGFMVEFDNLFSEVLKRTLNNKSQEKFYEVINAGTSGWSTDQELIYFQTEGKRYNPDLTILMFYENDITYNNRPKDWGMYYKPLFKLERGKLLLTNVPVPKPDKFIYYNYLESKQISIFKKIRKWLHEHSYLYNLIKERINNTYFLRKIAIKYHLMKDTKKEKDLLPLEYRVWEKKSNDAVRDAWEITEAMIVKLKEEAESIGSNLLVFNIPFEGSIYQKEWDKLKRKYGLLDDEWNVEQAGIELEAICKRNNIDFLNPTELFRGWAKEVEKDGIRLYDPIDHHWTVEGNKFAGEILADYIGSNHLGEQ